MSTKIAVRLTDVYKSFGGQEVLRGVDLSIRAGCVTGLLGPSGCGKTTIVNTIVGSIAVDKGSVEVLGEHPPLQKARRSMGFMPQSEALYADLTANENLRFFGALYGMRRRELDEAIPRVLALAHLSDQGKKQVVSFSGGMKRRLSLAIALLHSPRLLVLDEPTVGLDPKHRVELWRAFRSLAETGSALLLTTHVMDEAAYCDELVMIQDGRVLAGGSPAEILRLTGTDDLERAFLALEAGVGASEAAEEEFETRLPEAGRAEAEEFEVEASDATAAALEAGTKAPGATAATPEARPLEIAAAKAPETTTPKAGKETHHA